MAQVAIRSASLIVAALVVGAMFGIWLGYNPSALSAGAYVEQQQQAIRSLNVVMPVLGALAIALALLSAVKASGGVARALLFGAALCFVASGVVTRLRNQPINREVMTWNVQSPPADWRGARDEWWRWHIIRTSTGLLGLALLTVGSLTARERAGARV
jgi:uncharacterized membrane protein